MKRSSCILIVEDSEADCYLHQITIEDLDCTDHIEIARDGRAALEFLRAARSGHCQLPEIILLDINMPVMTGWEFLAQCESERLLEQRDVVVAILSTSCDRRDIERSRQHQAVHMYLQKPLTVDGLERALACIRP